MTRRGEHTLPTLRDLRRIVGRARGPRPWWATRALVYGFGAATPDGGVDWAPLVHRDEVPREIDRLISRHGPLAPLVVQSGLSGAQPVLHEPCLVADRYESADGDAPAPRDGGNEGAARDNRDGDSGAERSGGAGHPETAQQSGTADESGDGLATDRREAPGQDSEQSGAAGQTVDGQDCGPQSDGESESAGMGSGGGTHERGADNAPEGAGARCTRRDLPAQGADGDGRPSGEQGSNEEPRGGDAGSPPRGRSESGERSSSSDSECNDKGGGGTAPAESTSSSADRVSVEDEADAVRRGMGRAASIRIPAIEEAEIALLRRAAAIRRARRAIERMLRQIIAPRGRRVPLVDERKLVSELITRRCAVSRARQERGQPRRIIISPDGSPSCADIVDLTMGVARALQREMPGSVMVVPNANGCPYVGREDWGDWPEALRRIGRAKGVVPGGSPFYDTAPIGFWGRVLRERVADAILYVGDTDADSIWKRLADRRIIAVRLVYVNELPIDPAQAVDVPRPDDPLNIPAAIARALDRARIKL